MSTNHWCIALVGRDSLNMVILRTRLNCLARFRSELSAIVTRSPSEKMKTITKVQTLGTLQRRLLMDWTMSVFILVVSR